MNCPRIVGIALLIGFASPDRITAQTHIVGLTGMTNLSGNPYARLRNRTLAMLLSSGSRLF